MIVSLYDCFKPWSAKGSVFIISDTHFDDIDRSFMGYNISEQEQMNILKKYIHKNDTLIHLGDVGNPEYAPKLILSHEPVDVPWAINIHGHDHAGGSDKTHINLAPPKTGFVPFNLGMSIKDGLLSNIEDIHRLTIDKARENPIHHF